MTARSCRSKTVAACTSPMQDAVVSTTPDPAGAAISTAPASQVISGRTRTLLPCCRSMVSHLRRAHQSHDEHANHGPGDGPGRTSSHVLREGHVETTCLDLGEFALKPLVHGDALTRQCRVGDPVRGSRFARSGRANSERPTAAEPRRQDFGIAAVGFRLALTKTCVFKTRRLMC